MIFSQRRASWRIFLVIFSIIIVLPFAVQARIASLVIDAENGHTLHENDADGLRYPASLTKMMTLYMVFDALDRGQLTLAQDLDVSSHAASQSPTKLGLLPGQRISVENVILGMVTRSANDAAVVAAEAIGGSEDHFGELMTAKAHALGMTNSQFHNASGLPDPEQVTTARDMSILARALIKNYPGYYGYFSTKSFVFRGRTIGNHNRLLSTYEGADGIKTGFIRASGYNLVASAQRNGQRLIGVVMGSRSSADRARLMTALLDHGFAGTEPPDVLVAAADGRRPDVGSAAAAALLTSAAASSSDDARSSAAASSGDWGMQVGSFSGRKQAVTAARRAMKKAGSEASSARIEVSETRQRGGKKLYVARLTGVSREAAVSGCRKIKAGKQACNTVSLGGDTMVASAAPVQAAAPVPAAAIAAPVAKPSSGGGDWSVDVGRFANQKDAYNAAGNAVRRASSALDGGRILVIDFGKKRKSGRYLARVDGLSQSDANNGCRTLKKARMSCSVASGKVVETTTAAAAPRPAPAPSVAKSAAAKSTAAKEQPAAKSSGSSAGTWAVNLGSYTGAASAQRGARQAMRAAPQALNDGTIRVVKFNQRGGARYQAHIVGVDRQEAQKACARLEAREISCAVVRM